MLFFPAELIEEEEAFHGYLNGVGGGCGALGVGGGSATLSRRKTDDPETERRKRIRNNFSRLVRCLSSRNL